MRILLYYQKKELTNESIRLSLSHTFPDSSLHSPINADLLSTSPFTVPIFFFLHLSPQVSLLFFFLIFSNLLLFTWPFQSWYPDFSAQKKEKKKKRKLEVFESFFFFICISVYWISVRDNSAGRWRGRLVIWFHVLTF